MTMTASGPTSADLIGLSDRYTAHNYHPLPVVAATAEGAWITDVDGRRYLDCLAAYSAVNFGHGHPRLLARAQEQLSRLTLTSRAFHNDQLGPFAEALAGLTGKDVVLTKHAQRFAETLRHRGFNPIGVDLSELLKAGGGAKCCTLEIRA